MGPLWDELMACGSRVLLDHSRSLIALVTPGGDLVECNASMEHVRSHASHERSLAALLDGTSQPRFLKLIEEARAGQRAGPAILHFVSGPTGLAQSYRCQIFAACAGQLVLLAEPIEQLDRLVTEQHIRVTNQFALVTRSLQRASYELEQKQRMLEATLHELQQIAYFDELTGLANRRSILLRLQEESDRASRYGSTFSVMLIDIDHFKQVNDRYGHPAGDEVLRDCARLLQRSIRSTDHLGRYGGEEFLGILPLTGAAAAAELAERLRRTVAQDAFTAGQTITFAITISIGVAQFDPPHTGADLVIAHADSALLTAKARGRNCYAVWSPELGPG